MARIKLILPPQFTFTTHIPVRITDINYGGHLGNDTLLSILHEARVQYLQFYNYTELNIEGKSLIMADVGIEYKGEAFAGDVLTINLVAFEFTKYGFDLGYQVQNQHSKLIALAKTGMVCFDYEARKISTLPAAVQLKLV